MRYTNSLWRENGKAKQMELTSCDNGTERRISALPSALGITQRCPRRGLSEHSDRCHSHKTEGSSIEIDGANEAHCCSRWSPNNFPLLEWEEIKDAKRRRLLAPASIVNHRGGRNVLPTLLTGVRCWLLVCGEEICSFAS